MPIVNKNKPFDYAAQKSSLTAISETYPFIDLFSLGQSHLGRELYCVRWGRGKTRIFLNGAHHGCEWITSLILAYFLEEISRGYALKEEIDQEDICSLYRKVSFYICPMVNPDGVNLAISGLTDDIPPKTQEKLILYNNSSQNFIGSWQANVKGVDLNHNYDAGFFEGKEAEKKLSIYRPAPTRFSGKSPESEPEVQAMVKFTRMLMPDIAIAYHTQGEEIYYRFGEKEPENSKKIGEKMADLLGYRLSSPEGMASYSGYKDWVISALGICAYTIEAGLGKNPLPLSDFDDIYLKNRKMLLRLFTDCLQIIS